MTRLQPSQRRQRPLRHRPLRLRPLRLSLEQLEARTMLAESSGSFNGAAYLVTNRSSIPASSFSAGYTIEAWVRRGDANRCEAVLTSGHAQFGGLTDSGFFFGLCNGGRPFFNSNVAGGGHTGVTPIPAGVWTHLAATWSVFGERIYVNGELDASFAANPEPRRDKVNLYVGTQMEEVLGPDIPVNQFFGSLSEVRFWNAPRSQDQIRRSMHQLIEGQPSDLVAAWHLNGGNFADSAHNLPTTVVSVASGLAAPPVARVSEVDANFNLLPAPRSIGSAAYVPATNTAYYIGGSDGAAYRREILAMDMGTGNVTTVANLPVASGAHASVYVPDTNSIYIFGGFNGVGPLGTIVKYDLTTNAVSLLPTAGAGGDGYFRYYGSAVWHSGIKRVVVMGGFSSDETLNSIVLYDPATETSSVAAMTLPQRRYAAAAAYSPVTQRVYLFGGNDGTGSPFGTRNAVEIEINADGSGAAAFLPQADLPLNNQHGAAFEDPESHLIYVLGGLAEYVQAFDPRTGKSWRTTIRMPRDYNINSNGNVLNREGQAVVFSARNRHALVIGAGNSALERRKVWRVPLGDGPAVPQETWGFVNDLTGKVDGDDRNVFVSGNGNTVQVTGIDENGARSNFGFFCCQINDLAYTTDGGMWLGTGNFGARKFYNGTTTSYSTPELGTNKVWSVQPDFSTIGTDRGLLVPKRFGSGFDTYFHPNTFDNVFAQTGAFGLTYAVILDRSAVDSGAGPWRLGRVEQLFDPVIGVYRASAQWQSVCGDHAPIRNFGLESYNDLTLDQGGNLWIVGKGQGSESICLLPASTLAGTPTGGLTSTTLGNWATAVDVDADNRVWVGMLAANNIGSGGLAVYQLNTATSQLRSSEYNWANAPIGSRQILSAGGTPVWNSSVKSVAGVDEKVWISKELGGLVTVAQRWQQLDDVLANQTVTGIWTVAGRTFFAAGSLLFTLEPDGFTVTTRNFGFGVIPVSVASDGAGRIWVGTNQGPRLYLPSGFDDLTDRAGTRPAGKISAIAEAYDADLYDGQAAPVWLGGDDGLTLFDRNRFVTTFTAANSGLPSTTVKSVLVDRDGNIWAGTNAGLARLSPDMATWTTFTTANGLPSNAIFDLAQLGDGRIAISTANGLSLYNGTTFALQTPPVTATNLPLSVDDQGRLWAGSALLTAAGWRGYWSTNSGLAYSTISDTATDGADRIWFSHAPNPGVSVRGTFLPPLKSVTPVITSYSPTQGSQGDVITINGFSLGSDPSEIDVTVGGSSVDILSVTESQVRVALRRATTSGAVSLTRSGKRTTATTPFCAAPVIHSFTPTGASAGVQVSVYGSNLDPDAKLRFGDGTLRSVVSPNGTRIDAIVESDDVAGLLTVTNHCAGVTTTSAASFRKIDPSIPELRFNQGLEFYGVVEDKPTLAAAFVNTPGGVSMSERFEIDEATITFQLADGSSGLQRYQFPQNYVAKSLPAVPNDAQLKDPTANAVVVSPMYFTQPGATQATLTLTRRGRTVASAVRTINVATNEVTRVLLVPVMPAGYTRAQVDALKANVDGNLNELRERMMPMGTVELAWAYEEVVSDPFDLGAISPMDLAYQSIPLGKVRKNWNKSRNFPAQVVVGVMDPSIVMGNTPGVAQPNENARNLNAGIIDFADAVCDVGNAILEGLSFGLFGSGSCNVEFAEYAAWVVGGPHAGYGLTAGGAPDPVAFQKNMARTMGHEIGHTLDLVKPTALNGSATDNPAHSVNDEVAGTNTCNSAGATFDAAKTLYRQPGVTQPIVNPLSGTTFLPQLTGMVDTKTMRAKAIMSYACNREVTNSFFEPADLTALSPRFAPLAATLASAGSGSPPAPSAAASSPSAPRPAAGPGMTMPRIHLAGVINLTDFTGELATVEPLGDMAPLTMNFASEYALVQLDEFGTELSRLGIIPAGGHTDNDEAPAGPLYGYFSATMIREPGVAAVQLRRGGDVLDTFAAGATAPDITLDAPLGGAVDPFGEFATVAWTASDLDGDPVSIVVEYSADDGATWTPVGSSIAAVGSLDVPLASLPAADGTARVRVTANDGLHETSVVSDPFTVLASAVQAYIDQAGEAIVATEGQRVVLSGYAHDNVVGVLSGDQLSWSSHLDGFLGTGATLPVHSLSVGNHVVNLFATSPSGQIAVASRVVDILPDYDYDGIGDAQESLMSLSPLNGQDVNLDADGDSLTLYDEFRRGLDPNLADTDGDGRSDDLEVAADTDPTLVDDPPAADQLAISPTRVDLTTDLAGGVALPQATLAVFSRAAADWSVTSDVSWLEVEVASGTTPARLLLRAQAHRLADGLHSATLTFHSVALDSHVDVPVTVTVANRAGWFDLNHDNTTASDDCQLVQPLVGLTTADAGYDYHYDLDRDGTIESQDVGVCQAVVSGGVRGDFDLDLDVDADDIDLLFAAVASGANDPAYDLTADNLVTTDDVTELVVNILGSNFGDADLNRRVEPSDVAIVAGNFGYAATPAWSRGDFNGDGQVNLVDLAITQSNLGFAGSPAAPESVEVSQTADEPRPMRLAQARVVRNPIGRNDASPERIAPPAKMLVATRTRRAPRALAVDAALATS